MPHPSIKPATWFVSQGGKVYGPLDSARLKKLAATGKIAGDSGIAKESYGPWTAASRVRGLFPAGQDVANDGMAASVEEDAPPAQTNKSWLGRRVKKRSGPTIGDTKKVLWYFRGEGEDATGPFTAAEIEKLVDRDVVKPSTFVLRHGSIKWETAFSAGLFLDDPAEKPPATNEAGESSTALDTATPGGEMHAEEVLWRGRASHHANYGTYFLCALGAPLYYPAKWGIQRFHERNAIRYKITLQKVQVEKGVNQKQQTDIPLTNIDRVELDTPQALRDSQACNILLYGRGGGLLAVLEGIPLDEAARVISLCESAVHHQLKVGTSARVLAHQRVQEELARRQEERARRRLEQQQQRATVTMATTHTMEAQRRAIQLQLILGDDCPSDVIERSLEAHRNYSPPKPPRRESTGRGWFGWLAEGQPETTSVRGFYRNGDWVRPHKRRKHH